LLKLSEIKENERKKCGYFCFINPIEKLYKDDKEFSCKYVPPVFEIPFLGSDKVSSFDLKQDLVQSVVVETFCGKEKKDTQTKKRDLQDKSDDMKIINEIKTNLVPAKEALEELKRQLKNISQKEKLFKKQVSEELKKKSQENQELRDQLSQEKQERAEQEKLETQRESQMKQEFQKELENEEKEQNQKIQFLEQLFYSKDQKLEDKIHKN
jgi:hypothetical protein